MKEMIMSKKEELLELKVKLLILFYQLKKMKLLD